MTELAEGERDQYSTRDSEREPAVDIETIKDLDVDESQVERLHGGQSAPAGGTRGPGVSR